MRPESVGMRDGEGAAEAAALVGPLGRDELELLDGGAAAARAGSAGARRGAGCSLGVPRPSSRSPWQLWSTATRYGKRAPSSVCAEHAHEELAELEGALRLARARSRAALRAERGEAVPHGRDAARRGRDDRLGVGEAAQVALGEPARLARRAAVQEGLAAAALLRVVVHLAARALEHPQRRPRHVGRELIHVAGDEERDVHVSRTGAVGASRASASAGSIA